MLTNRLTEYLKLMRVDRPIGTYLLLWPTLCALWLASEGQPRQILIIIFCAGVFLMRSAGCVINDLADREFDPHVERTKSRPLAAQTITVIEAIILLIVLLASSLYLAFFLNTFAKILAIPAACIAISYPFMKRFHSLPQAHLGLAFSFGIPMAYAAILNRLPFEAWLLFFINVLWVLIYDTQYAMSDREDDKKIAVKSSALLLEKWCGKYDYLVILGLQILMVLGLFWLGRLRHFSWVWDIVLVTISCFFIKHLFWIKSHDRHKCFAAFLDNNWVGLILFIGIVSVLLPV